VVEPQAQFERLYREYADRVHAYALRRTTPGAADDVVAEVFLVVWRRLGLVPDEPLPWLLGVAPGNGDALYPASAQVAWAATQGGTVLRTADGGRTWTPVWSAGRPEAAAPANLPPA